MAESFGDILTAMVTPFTLDLQVDQVAFAGLADHLLANGSDGLVVAGTTGESPTLTDDEKVALFRRPSRSPADAARSIAGTGSNDTAHSVALTRRAEDAGVDAVLVVTPYYNKPPERGLRAHFEAVAAATNLPVIIYNIPSRCVVNLAPELLAELVEHREHRRRQAGQPRPRAVAPAPGAVRPRPVRRQRRHDSATSSRWAAGAASRWPPTWWAPQMKELVAARARPATRRAPRRSTPSSRRCSRRCS